MSQSLYQILLADDDEVDHLFFRDAISELKIECKVHIVNDGAELMNYLTQKDLELPYLLFLDINMPRKNGMKALQEIRDNQKLKDLRVVMYSTSNAHRDIEDAFMKGADGYIVKPSDFETLKNVVGKAILTNWHTEERNLTRGNFVLSA